MVVMLENLKEFSLLYMQLSRTSVLLLFQWGEKAFLIICLLVVNCAG